ncbi:IS110 family RNA-guided transposase [Mariniplasma anaerobium]|uniref:IS110 family transposase n=1 Tax=Mariniplasma anaerobium TaxID=2735436 RepID=A0A7U9THT8_9MOLU|nr:IS110 family transposase [Mariniplasma anaerobium]BCR35514.1 IS110 family transposase [Mariniplasma anaerobium]BCR36740.1 IS110 family transposase [Mariniplasma anaerobium]
MIYIGIDVASNKHDIVITNNLGVLFKKPFKIINDLEGYKKLLSEIKLAKEFFCDQIVRIGLESTGHYSRNILHYLIRGGYDVMFINPLLTNMDRKASSVRKTKTDSIDAKAICMFLIRNQNDFKPYTLSSYHIDELKTLVRLRKSLKKQINKDVNQLHAYIDQAFPEYNKIFNKLVSKTSLAVLARYASLSELKRVRLNTLIELIKTASKGHLGLIQAKDLKSLPLTSIGMDSQALSFSIKGSIVRINLLNDQVSLIEEEIKLNVDMTKTTLLSIPGISYTTGGIILAEIGDISLFKSADALLAFAGLDPSVYQSGKFEGNYRISKRGSSIFRWAMFQSAQAIVKFDPTFKAYYLKKKAQGKKHRNIIGHVTKKLMRVIYSILKNNSTYIK